MKRRWDGGIWVPITGSPPFGATSHWVFTAAIQYSRVAAWADGGTQGQGDQQPEHDAGQHEGGPASCRRAS